MNNKLTIFLLRAVVLILQTTAQNLLILPSTPQLDQFKPKGTSKTYIALFGLHIDITTDQVVRVAKSAGIVYSIDGGKWNSFEAQYSQMSFTSSTQSFALILNVSSSPHPVSSIKYAVWVDLTDGSKKWNNNLGEDFFAAFPEPTPEARLDVRLTDQTLWQCQTNATFAQPSLYQLNYNFKTLIAPLNATTSLNVTIRVSTSDGALYPWVTQSLIFAEKVPLFPAGFGNELRPFEIWISKPSSIKTFQSKTPFDEIQFYVDAISTAAPKNAEMHRLRSPSEFSQVFTMKVNPFLGWQC